MNIVYFGTISEREKPQIQGPGPLPPAPEHGVPVPGVEIGACTGPSRGPIQAKNGRNCLHRSINWTYMPFPDFG